MDKYELDGKMLGKRINIARKSRGLTNEKLSEMCSINATFLRQIEGGTKGPSLSVFTVICKNLNVSADYLLFGDLGSDLDGSISPLIKLQENATPRELKLITAMIDSAIVSETRHYFVSCAHSL